MELLTFSYFPKRFYETFVCYFASFVIYWGKRMYGRYRYGIGTNYSKAGRNSQLYKK